LVDPRRKARASTLSPVAPGLSLVVVVGPPRKFLTPRAA
jgi:hypothetical protein